MYRIVLTIPSMYHIMLYLYTSDMLYTFVSMVTTTEGIRIDLPLLEYSKRRNVVLQECYLVLGERYIHYKITGSYEALNEDTDVWEEKKANYRWCRPRKNFSDVAMYYDNPEKLYSLSIDFTGITDGNSWLFTTGKEAKEVYDKLMLYMTQTTDI